MSHGESPLPFDEAAELRREEAKWWITRSREELANAWRYRARQPCPECGTDDAVIVPTGGQNTVRCQQCGRHLYNAPKTETGERLRTVQSLRRDIKPSQQARILDRDSRQCVLCGISTGLMAI